MFAFALLVVSTLTGLVVQAIKAMLAENHIVMKKPNTVAGIVAIVLAALLGVGWVLYTGAVWSVQLVLLLVALAFLSWLCAMLGYDKVMQTLAQLKR
jgi:uncharacterized membrane protein YqgA involved in biofilm formation